MLYPFKFKPAYKDYIWGGRNLEKFGLVLPEGIIAEVWEISSHSDGVSTVSNGEYNGTPLTELLVKLGRNLVGNSLPEKDVKKFPLLIKLIDANDNLSVQVHPGDNYAKAHENGELGKNEMWYILSAKPSAKLIYDVNPGVDRASFAKAVSNDKIEECIKHVEVFAGDTINIPEGLIHAIGEGIVLVEIQQNSNTTYRVFDYNRTDSNGNRRPLHIDKALDVIDFDSKNRKEKCTGLSVSLGKNSNKKFLIANKYFSVELYDIDGKLDEEADGSKFFIYIITEGEAIINYQNGSEKIKLAESVLIPACLGKFSFEGKFKMLKTYVPNLDQDIISPLFASGYTLEEIQGNISGLENTSSPAMSDFDLHLFNEGSHHKIYEKLGAHIWKQAEIEGTLFSVWAPCAIGVSVVGNFNQWDGCTHIMNRLGSSGVWELFIPRIEEGETYKYEIKTAGGDIYLKADPYAYFSELRPNTASIVYDVNNYKWHDENWISERDSSNIFQKPISIYEVHLGSWSRISEESNRFLTYKEYADKLVKYVLEVGYTHIELLPISEFPFDGSWGYQQTGYYAVTSRYGTPNDFKYFVDKCHENGIGVILDWVPAHFPKDAHGLARFDGTALYEHLSPKQGEHPDWGTLIFNYGRNEVKNFLISNAVFWFEKYHIDGLRVDAVASMLYLDYGKKDGEWIPNKLGGKENIEAVSFLRQLNSTVFNYFSGVMMIAEESTSWPMVSQPVHVGGLGFSFKWNMGWMNDFITYISMDPIYRKYHQNNLTFSMMYAFSENFVLVLSHDEVVHGKRSLIGKMPGDYWQKFAGLRVSFGYMYGHPGKKLNFMGSEFGQFIEWDYNRSLDWHLLDIEMHQKLLKFVKDLNLLYRKEKALFELDSISEGFEWIDCKDTDNSIFSFVRKGIDWHDMLIFVCNFTPEVHENYRVGVPFDTTYQEVLNSDSEIYGGSNVGNLGEVHAQQHKHQERPYSIVLRVPPLATVIFRPII